MKYIIQLLILILVSTSAIQANNGDETEKSLVEAVEVTRSMGGEYKILNNRGDVLTIYAGKDAKSIDWSKPLYKNVKDTEILIKGKHADRMFFGIMNVAGDKSILTERHIEMDGPVNFRDVGGLKTKEGKQVKWGLIYRADKLSELSDKDHAKFKELNIQTVVDFRTNRETKEEPDNLPQNQKIKYVHLPTGEENMVAMAWLDSLRKVKRDQLDEFMIGFYKQIPLKWTSNYKSLFKEFANKKSPPLVFHCTAGKDRTGIASALFLYTLGVDMDLIMKEYELSNYYRKEANKEYTKMFTQYGIDPGIGMVLMGVKGFYMKEIFETIEKQYGSLDAFLESELGVTKKVKAKLRKVYLY